MDINASGQTPATDDQELAKVLAGMNEQTQALDQNAADAAAAAAPPADPMHFEESVLPTSPADSTASTAPALPEVPPLGDPTPVAAPVTSAAAGDTEPQLTPELESLKKDALSELRPLVDKLDLPAEEKFDTLLLIIRSTDDQSLLSAAHDAAKAIENETKRAQALLDVIKEIDFFATQKVA